MAVWAAKWHSLDKEYIINHDCLPMLFRTKRECTAWIREQYGYIAKRQDLRGAPHFWRMPKPVEVLVFEITHLKGIKP